MKVFQRPSPWLYGFLRDFDWCWTILWTKEEDEDEDEGWQDRCEHMRKGRVVFHEGILETESLTTWFPEWVLLALDDLLDVESGDRNI